MSKFKFVLNRAGVRELLNGEAMEAIVAEKAQRVLETAGAGNGYEMSVHHGRNRVNASVKAETIKAKRSNAKHNTLLKALGSAKG